MQFKDIITDPTQFRQLMGEPPPPCVAKTIARLDRHCRAFIAKSPFLLIASSNARGQMDISPKGDPPGFVRVLDDLMLAIPDRPGNRRADTYTNVLENPRVGIIFLVPGKSEIEPGQSTEAVVGPYELQDFNLYYTLRFGYLPTKVAFMAWCTWRDRGEGTWPDIPVDRRNQYVIADIKRWLTVFARRFFQLSQYKRSAIPNAPKVGSGGSLSPRSDYRAPSDSEAAVWLADVERIPDRLS